MFEATKPGALRQNWYFNWTLSWGLCALMQPDCMDGNVTTSSRTETKFRHIWFAETYIGKILEIGLFMSHWVSIHPHCQQFSLSYGCRSDESFHLPIPVGPEQQDNNQDGDRNDIHLPSELLESRCRHDASVLLLSGWQVDKPGRTKV